MVQQPRKGRCGRPTKRSKMSDDARRDKQKSERKREREIERERKVGKRPRQVPRGGSRPKQKRKSYHTQLQISAAVNPDVCHHGLLTNQTSYTSTFGDLMRREHSDLTGKRGEEGTRGVPKASKHARGQKGRRKKEE